MNTHSHTHLTDGGKRTVYREYVIKPKLDFGTTGYLINGRRIGLGFVVTDKTEFVNVMPGAAWFESERQAQEAIDILIACKGDAAAFWMAMSNKQKSPESVVAETTTPYMPSDTTRQTTPQP